jgi:hypothetical protein
MTAQKSSSQVLRLGPGLVFHLPYLCSKTWHDELGGDYYLRVELGPRDEVFPNPRSLERSAQVDGTDDIMAL